MINKGKNFHYLAVTNLSALIKRISSNHDGDVYCLNCSSSYTTKNKLKEHEEICNNNDSCRIDMPCWVEKTLRQNPGEKSLKAPYAVYIDSERILKKEQPCQNNPERSYTEKKTIHESSGWPMLVKCSFDKKENKFDYCRGKDCIEKSCKKLKENVMEIINRKEKDMIPLNKEEEKFYKKQKVCHICKEKFCTDKDNKDYINRKKVKDHCHYTGKFRGAAHSKCNLNYKVQKEIPIIIHNATYDTHFIINQLAIEFKGELNCIGDNMEKYITFSVPIKKECKNGKIITYKLKFIDSSRFVLSLSSELVYNTPGNFSSIECKSCKEINRCEECKKSIDELTKIFSSIYQFCNGELNKFVLLLRKGVYPYEYMDS